MDTHCHIRCDPTAVLWQDYKTGDIVEDGRSGGEQQAGAGRTMRAVGREIMRAAAGTKVFQEQ